MRCFDNVETWSNVFFFFGGGRKQLPHNLYRLSLNQGRLNTPLFCSIFIPLASLRRTNFIYFKHEQLQILGREPVASTCLDVQRNPWISECIFMKSWMFKYCISVHARTSTHGHSSFTDPSSDVLAWMSK